jgi:hypothetical protein
MKICTICKRQYADSLTFCLDDGTVLTAAADANPTLVDPAATLRFEARETHAPPAVKRSGPLIWIAVAAAAIILVISVVGVAGLWLIGSSNNSQTNSSSGPAAKPTPISTLSASEEVVQANNAVGAALVSGDTDALSRLLADDYRYVSDDGVTLNKAEVLMLMRTGNLSYEYLNTTDPTVDVDSGSAKADLSARATAKGQLRREPFTDSYFYRNTYEKRGGRWQLVSGTVWHRQ